MTEKPKIKETGAQVAATGAAGSLLTVALDIAQVSQDAFADGGWMGLVALGMGLAYRLGVKWLASYEVELPDSGKLDEIANETWEHYGSLAPTYHDDNEDDPDTDLRGE